MPCGRLLYAVSDAKGIRHEIDAAEDGHSEFRECPSKVLWESDHKGGCDTEARSRSSGRLMALLVVTSGSE